MLCKISVWLVFKLASDVRKLPDRHSEDSHKCCKLLWISTLLVKIFGVTKLKHNNPASRRCFIFWKKTTLKKATVGILSIKLQVKNFGLEGITGDPLICLDIFYFASSWMPTAWLNPNCRFWEKTNLRIKASVKIQEVPAESQDTL